MKLLRYHRWLVLPFGLILLWVALTGVTMQALDIYDKGLFPAEDHGAPPKSARLGIVTPAQAHEPGEVEPAPATPAATAPARPPRSKAQQLHGLLQHLHSGEWFGPFGTIIQTLAGLALLFFAVSGMWMYVRMFRARGDRPGQAKWFW